jgi:phosphate transport system protein
MTSSHTSEPLVGADPRSHFHEQLDQIRFGLIELGGLVVENLGRAGEAMREGRLELIPQVRQADETINQQYFDLERMTFEILARQQPVAGDLRFLVAATRIVYEQERSGDLVVNCVNMLERLDGFPEGDKINALLSQLIEASARIFAMSVDALRTMDPKAGVDIDVADDEVDDIVSLFYTEIGRVADDIGLEHAIALSRVGRFLERIADHGVNIGENVTYVVTAEFPQADHVTPSDEV